MLKRWKRPKVNDVTVITAILYVLAITQTRRAEQVKHCRDASSQDVTSHRPHGPSLCTPRSFWLNILVDKYHY